MAGNDRIRARAEDERDRPRKWPRPLRRISFAILFVVSLVIAQRIGSALFTAHRFFSAMRAREFRAAVDTLSWSSMEDTARTGWNATPEAWSGRWRLTAIGLPRWGLLCPPNTTFTLESDGGRAHEIRLEYVSDGRINEVFFDGHRPFH